MRFIKQIPHLHISISLLEWNEKYIVKLEAGTCEQAYKIPKTEISNESELEKKIEQLANEAVEIFKQMHTLQASTFYA